MVIMSSADAHTMELAHYGNGNIKGVVNDDTAHVQKGDLSETTVLSSTSRTPPCGPHLATEMSNPAYNPSPLLPGVRLPLK